MTTVTCPGCGQRVVPATRATPGASEPSPPSGPGRRWSFIWRPPSGPVCPECFFPLERLARRLKGVHTASLGMTLLILGVLVTFVRLARNQGEWMATFGRIVFAAGGMTLVVGAFGIVVGGRASGPAPLR